MHCPTTSGLVLAALLMLPGLGHAEEPRGRSHTWDLEATAGMSFLDSGFNAKVMGYRLVTPTLGTSKVPPTEADHLEVSIPTLGLRVGYNFTRYFSLELGGVLGETEVGSDTKIRLEENFTLANAALRQTVLAQQTATAPGILAAYESLDFDYTNANLMGVFKFNNRTTSRWVFYGSFGGGYFSLNPNSAPFNACDVQVVTDPSIDPFNDDPNDVANPDFFQDNPEQLKVVPGCNRAFLTATSVGVVTNDVGEQVLDIVLGSYFLDADAVQLPREDEPPLLFSCAAGEALTSDPETRQIFCDAVPQWKTPPGVLATSGFATTGKVRGFEDFFFSLGGGARWHFKPRHVLRIDLKRHFIENQNKNINEVTFGWSFVLGRGKPDVDAGAAPPPLEFIEDEGVPAPAEDDGTGLS